MGSPINLELIRSRSADIRQELEMLRSFLTAIGEYIGSEAGAGE